MTNTNKQLGVITLTLMSVAAIANLRNLPMMAVQGYGCIWFYLVTALCYFLPAALICSECASRKGATGGLYGWVKMAFGPRVGFLAIWLAIILNIAFLPTALAYLASTLGQMVGATWINRPFPMLLMMLVLLWGITFINYLGIESSTRLNRWALILGTLIPGGLMISLALYWVGSGQPLQVQWEQGAWIPDLKFDNLVFLVGVMLAFQGIEMGGYHSDKIKNPQTTFAKATFFATIILLMLSVLGSLSIAWVVPTKDINLVQGVMQVIQAYFAAFNLPVGSFLVGACIFLGGMATLSTWIAGPVKGLQVAAEEGLMPAYFASYNAKGAPVALINWQSGIVSALMIVGTLVVPDVEGLYWLLTILAAQFAFIAYILLFAAAVVMKARHPATIGFKIPGGVFGTAVVGGVGIVTCAAGFFLGFVPPQTIATSALSFMGELLIAITILLAPGLWLCMRYKNKSVLSEELLLQG